MCTKYIVLALLSFFTLNAHTIAVDVPGTIVNHMPASSGIYIGSPGIVAIDEGVYLAKHDEFGPNSTEWESAVTRIYRSDNSGKSWRRVSTVEGLFWASIFTHNDAVYLFGTDKHHGNTVIMRSDDEGKTWTEPLDDNSGLLLKGQYHTAPVPVLIHNGRIWRAMEDATDTMSESGGPWGGPKYGSFMMSAPVDSDLLKSENWTVSNVVQRQDRWLDGQTRAWLEGNAVVTPKGSVACVLRVNFQRDPVGAGGIAAIVHISEDGTEAVFNPDEDFIEFPGGAKKFTIRYDKKSQKYWTLTNYVPSRHRGRSHAGGVRNTVALASSTDLRNWKIEDIVLYHPDIRRHGFQYIDWQFEGDDLIAASRTAYDDSLGGARSAHDANYLTFHRVENFRTRSNSDYLQSFTDLSQDLDSWHVYKPDCKDPNAIVD